MHSLKRLSVLLATSALAACATAPEFFAAAKIAPASQALVHDGKVEVPKHSALDVTLTPAAGQYSLKCTHMLHSSFGMNGTIVVR